MNSYYTTFDFGNKRVGFAPLAEGDGDECSDDSALDINNAGGPASTPTNNAPFAPTPAAPKAAPAAPKLGAGKQAQMTNKTDGKANGIDPKVAVLGFFGLAVLVLAFVIKRRRHRHYGGRQQLRIDSMRSPNGVRRKGILDHEEEDRNLHAQGIDLDNRGQNKEVNDSMTEEVSEGFYDENGDVSDIELPGLL